MFLPAYQTRGVQPGPALRQLITEESCCTDRSGAGLDPHVRQVVAKLPTCSLESAEKVEENRGETSVGEAASDREMMADEAAIVEEDISPAQPSASQSPLVAVTFQRDARRKQKYLEAEPKALGITQAGLSIYMIICVAVFQAKGLSNLGPDIAFFISSLLVVIAGNVAVAAQNLHVPTLRACLGMQIVSCGASIFNIVCSLIKMEGMPYYCWSYYYDNSTLHYGEICHKIENVQSHFYAGGVLIEATLLAISATLAAYCCKVVNCCGPAPKMPVITVQSPPVQQ